MVFLVGVILLARLSWLQLFAADRLRRQADGQYLSKVSLYPYRGIIYDRSGRPLTENLGDWVSIGINPTRVTEPIRFARDLSKVTGKPSKGFLEKLRRQKTYVVLARQISPQQAEDLRNLGWQFSTRPEMHRLYPHNSIAAQVLGFTDIDNQGISGLELTYDRILKGNKGWRVFQLDVTGRQHIDSKLPFKLQEDGGDLFTTVDMSIQAILQKELITAREYYNAQNAAGIVLHPRSGEILAMCSEPGFNPNSPKDNPVQSQRNIPVTDIYEPGSTFKIVLASHLIENGLANPNDTVDCGNGKIQIYDETIRDWHPYDKLSFREVIVNSSNIGMVRLAEKVSPRDFYQIISDFGFLGRTGVELSGEVSGRLPEPDKWSGLRRPNVAYGQGVAVTMLQLASAFGCIANDGVLMRPTLVRATRSGNGKVKRNKPLEVRRTVTKATADTITSFLVDAVERGTGGRAAIEGIDIAGKTGTAQLVNPAGGYYQHKFTASFVGFFPAEAPEFLILIALKDPQGPRGEHTGGGVAAPIFRKVAQQILGLRPDLRKHENYAANSNNGDFIIVPDLGFSTLAETRSKIEQIDLSLVSHGSGRVIYDQIPAPGTLVEKGEKIHVTLGPEESDKGTTVIIPLLTGLSLREAIRKATERGLALRIDGTGRVVKQTPRSGTKAAIGDICQVTARG